MKEKLEVVFLAILLAFLVIGAFPIVKAKTITVDGDPSDWTGTSPTTNNTWIISAGEYIWRDELGDDAGNGSWVYPTGYVGGEADLLELRITWDADANYLYLLFVLDDIPEGQWNRTAIDFAIDTDQTSGSGQVWLGEYSDMKVISEAYWEWHVSIVAMENIAVKNSTFAVVANTTYPADTPMLIANSSTYDCFEVGVPLAVIGSPADQTWRFVCVVGLQDEHARWGGNVFAEIFPTADENNPGGGEDAWEDPDAFDGAFYESKADQELEFGAFIPGGGEEQVAVVFAYADIEMDLIPEFPAVWFIPATLVTATALTIALKKIRKL